MSGFGEHEITGGRGSFTVKLALHEAMPCLLPSLKFAVATYVPGCHPAVSTCADALLPEILPGLPDQLYLMVRFGLKFDPVAVTVSGSPANISRGCAVQTALAGGGGGPPPNLYTSPI